jgi:hypothetical protein
MKTAHLSKFSVVFYQTIQRYVLEDGICHSAEEGTVDLTRSLQFFRT